VRKTTSVCLATPSAGNGRSRPALTPIERWRAALRREAADRPPADYWATPEFSAKLVRHLGLSSRAERGLVSDLSLPLADNNARPSDGFTCLRRALDQLGVDFVVKPVPRYSGPALEPDTDEFGCRHRPVAYPAGSYDETVSHPLAAFATPAEVEQSYRWPEPDWWDYSTIAQQVRGRENHPVQAGGSEPFMLYKDLRGDGQAYLDLALNPDMVHYCLDRLFDLACERTRRILAALPAGLFLTCYVAEDLGAQHGLLMSPAHIRTYLLPRMKRMVELAHAHGAYVFHHDDGAIAQILPDLVELGIDILNPVQWRVPGMDRQQLKDAWGERLVFHGAMDNQKTLPFGTVEDVRQEVADNLRILGPGYVLAPCHNIQPITPVENVVAMYEACRAWRPD